MGVPWGTPMTRETTIEIAIYNFEVFLKWPGGKGQDHHHQLVGDQENDLHKGPVCVQVRFILLQEAPSQKKPLESPCVTPLVGSV